MKLDRLQDEIDLLHGIARVVVVIDFRQRMGEVIGGAGRVKFRIIQGLERVDLHDGGKKLLDQQPHFFSAGRGGDEFAAGDRVALVLERKDFPGDEGEIGARV
jgi:hypothetical protein